RGNKKFFMFGEVYSGDPAVTAPYVTKGRLQATLDFPFQGAARSYVSQGGSARNLADVYAQDYRYTGADTDAYELPTFLGNHDMGRFGSFLQSDNPGASNDALLAKDRLANELQFLTRGQPVVYYGDEQGFTGAGGDKDARQDMFASKTPSYNTDTVIGGASGSQDRYGKDGALYQGIAGLAKLRKDNPALADGAQVERYAADGPGVYAFSRIDAKEQVEYLAAVNNAGEAKTVTLDTFSAGMDFDGLYGFKGKVTSGADGKVTVTVPAMSSLVLKAEHKLAKPAAGPSITVSAPDNGSYGTVTLGADVPGGGFNRVTFAAQVGDGAWQTLGTADNGTYKVTQSLDGVAPGTVVRFKAVVEDSAGRLASTTGEFTTGQQPAAPVPSAVSREYAVVHYQRKDGDYDGWNLYTWGDIADGEATTWPAGHGFVGRDAYGAFAYVKLKGGASDVGFVVEKDGTKDVDQDRHVDISATGEVWIKEGDATVRTANPDAAQPVPDGKAVIHYRRADGNYTGWGLHDWTGAAAPTDWGSPLMPARQDAFGAVFEVPLAQGATSLSYIIHNGGDKDLPQDQSLDFATSGREIWIIGGQEGHLLPQAGGTSSQLDLGSAKAQWIDAKTVVVPANYGAGDAQLKGGTSAQLIYDPAGGLSVDKGVLSEPGHWIRLNQAAGLTDAQKAKFPHLAGYRAFTVDPRDAGRITAALRAQVVFTEHLPNGAALAATGVQTPGVLDDLYAAKAASAQLGPVYAGGSGKQDGNSQGGDNQDGDSQGKGNGKGDKRKVTLSLWAPTATDVAVQLFDKASGGSPKTVPLKRDDASGVWSLTGDAKDLDGKYYLYQVKVWAPSVQQMVTNLVTDPYSTALAADSKRSLVADLSSAATKPKGWDQHRSPEAIPAVKQQIQELHVRDFSSADSTVPADERGTYLAFTQSKSAGMQHLKDLAKAGVTTIHLLPTFDIATIRENRADQKLPACDLAALPADSDKQQECVAAVQADDAYNWGYDPLHYTVPEGSYATDPNGTARTEQFREMVQ
ncbi:MAG: DUF3372 domain-containing protein, partial [Kitasatospora sp.]|nr:DUF3372 domain-containing protein [Kitasatospora sp.]